MSILSSEPVRSVPSVQVLTVPTRDADRRDPKSWRQALATALDKGQRLVTLFGRKAPPPPEAPLYTVVLWAVLQDPGGALSLLGTQLDPVRGYHALTTEHPALHCFERELHEQLGLRVAGHPWLKPIRYEGQDQSAMDAYPFYKIDGKEVHEVAVGPIHAGVIEPGAFRFMCLGEQVHHLEIQLGYQHRGVEARLLEVDPRHLTPLVETIAGDTSVGHAWASVAALEALAGATISPEAELARAVMLELERVAMHLAGLAGLATDIGFLQGATTYGRLRTTAINTSMRLSGSRFGRGAIRPGGVTAQLADAYRAAIAANVTLLQADLAIINAHFLASRTVQHRLRGTGVVEAARAKEIGLVGFSARASGLSLDQRALHRQGVYLADPLTSVVISDGDCWARAKLRIDEIDVSLAWLARVLVRFPATAPPRVPLGPLAPETLAVAVVEGWRGEVVHALETGPDGTLVRYKVQDPSLRNWLGLALAVRGNEISDFPICNKSFDLSYCGNDL